jgi:trigger factor
MKLADLNQELFDLVFGKDAVKTEEEFRARIKSEMESVYEEDSNFKFIIDVKDYCLNKVGEVKFPEEIMKREMLLNAKDDEQKKHIEENFAETVKDHEWSLICSKLLKQLNVKIEDEQIKSAAKLVAKSQFAQYGLNNVPDEYLENYASEMLKDEKQAQRLVSRAIEIELTKAVKAAVKLQNKKITVDKFNALFENK